MLANSREELQKHMNWYKCFFKNMFRQIILLREIPAALTPPLFFKARLNGLT